MKKLYRVLFILLVVAFSAADIANGQTSTYNVAGTYTFTAPCGVTSVTVQCWGGGGGGGGVATIAAAASGGGAGGSYTSSTVTVIPGNTYTVVVGVGGTGGTATGGNGGIGASS